MLNLTVLVKPFDFSVGGLRLDRYVTVLTAKISNKVQGVDNQEHIFLISVRYAKNSSSCGTIYFRFSIKG